MTKFIVTNYLNRVVGHRKVGQRIFFQGGTAFICRSPIYSFSLDRDHRDDTYWGLASIVIDKDALFQIAGFYTQKNTIRVAIRGADGKGDQGGYIDGDINVFQEDPAVLSVNIPGGSWQMSILRLLALRYLHIENASRWRSAGWSVPIG